MTLLGNIIWFLLGGWLLGLGYFMGAVLFFPLLPFLMPLVGYPVQRPSGNSGPII